MDAGAIFKHLNVILMKFLIQLLPPLTAAEVEIKQLPVEHQRLFFLMQSSRESRGATGTIGALKQNL